MKLFSIGEFAEICGVKKQTLFHYDEIGLLKPDYKQDNGYRYYSLQQVEVFTVIEMLKEIDMSLADIKQFLEIRSPEETIALLAEKEQAMEEKIRKMQQIKRSIRNKREYIKKALTLDFSAITIEHRDSERYILSDFIAQYSEKPVAKLLMQFINESKKSGFDSGHPIGVLLPKEAVLANDYDYFSHFYLRIDADIQAQTHYREAGEYVVGYHEGSYIHIHKAYHKIKTYLLTHNYQIAGDSFEEYLLDETSVHGLENYVTRILIKVEPIKNH